MTVTDERAPRVYRSSHREAQARRTKQRVVAAATAEFLQRGYAGTTIRSVAAVAGVSVPTVEALFGTKARLLKATIDVAIAGDDEPVPILDRTWTAAILNAESLPELLGAVAPILAAAQARSAGLVLAAFEGSVTDPDLAQIAEQKIAERAATAAWLIEAIARTAPLSDDSTREELIDTLWVLMDPALFDRLTRSRHWSAEQWQRWFTRSVIRLLTSERPDAPPIPRGGRA